MHVRAVVAHHQRRVRRDAVKLQARGNCRVLPVQLNEVDAAHPAPGAGVFHLTAQKIKEILKGFRAAAVRIDSRARIGPEMKVSVGKTGRNKAAAVIVNLFARRRDNFADAARLKNFSAADAQRLHVRFPRVAGPYISFKHE